MRTCLPSLLKTATDEKLLPGEQPWPGERGIGEGKAL